MQQATLSRRALALVLIGAACAVAQTGTGQITGTVRDASGSVIPNVKVVITSRLTGFSRETKTNETGNYTFAFLPVSVYDVSAESAGFRPAKRSEIQLNVDQVVRVDLELAIGTVTEVVEVSAAAAAIDTETSTVGQVFSGRQITELPLNGRNFLQLLQLGAGTVEVNGEQGSFRRGTGNAISIMGSRATSNNYLLDGTANVDTSWNTPAITPSVDAIQEFKQQTTTYSAEYGFSANQINVISKSGANDPHGALFWFGRNDALDARNFFDGPTIAPLRQNQFGFVAGGPVVLPRLYDGRNKTFWLANYEGSRVRRSFYRFGTVPAPDELEGRFSTTVKDPFNGQPFPNNIIPPTRFSRLGNLARKNYFSAPTINLPQGNFRALVSAPFDSDQQTYRLDQMLGRFGTVMGRVTFGELTDADPTNLTPLGYQYTNQQALNWQASHTYTISPTMVNQFRLGYVRLLADRFGAAAPQSHVDALGLKGIFENLTDRTRTAPYIHFVRRGLTQVGGANNAYIGSNQPMLDITNATSVIRGAHSFNFGVNYRRWRLERNLANNFLGGWTFSGDFTEDPIADMLLGVFSAVNVFQPAAFSVPGQPGNPRTFMFQYLAPYFQDDWKVSPRLTLNLGLRWDFRTMPYEKNNRFCWLNPSAPQGGLYCADKQLEEKGVLGTIYTYAGRRTPHDAPKRVFAPRIGLAYRPFGGDRTVIRAGYGVFFDSAEEREIDGSSDVYPYTSRGRYQNFAGQPLKTSDEMFPSFTTPGPVTPAAISFLAVMQSERRRMPYMQQWSFSIQRQLTNWTTLELNYIGNKGTHLLTRRNINQAFPYDPANPLPVRQRRPYANFGTYINSVWDGNSSYNAFNTKLEHRTQTMVLSAVYTWAKSIDFKSAAAAVGNTGSGWQGNMNNHNTRLDRGLSDFHVPHRFVGSFVYNLPFGRGAKFLGNTSRWADALVGGWQLNGIVTLANGTPFSIDAADLGGLNDSFGPRADLVGQPFPGGFKPTLTKAFNTAAFAQPLAGFFGTAGRNIMPGAGPANWDLGAFKNFSFTEGVRLQLRIESFNAFNHTQFGNPGNNVWAGNYGVIGWARPARINQLGMKLLW